MILYKRNNNCHFNQREKSYSCILKDFSSRSIGIRNDIFTDIYKYYQRYV